MRTERHNNSEFEQQYQAYLEARSKVVNQLIGWVHGEIAEYPFQAVDEYLKKHSPADELWRRIVVQDLAIQCLARCFGHMSNLDYHLLAHAAYELKPENFRTDSKPQSGSDSGR